MAKLGTVPENFDITSCELSPSGTGVLLGYVPQTPLANHLGWSWVWEDFVTSPNEPPFQLMGGQGVWSRTKSYIATWDTMMNPDDATERLCHIRVWEYSPHRQLLKTLKDDGIPYWCCFVPNVHDKDTENLAACVVGDGKAIPDGTLHHLVDIFFKKANIPVHQHGPMECMMTYYTRTEN